MLQFLSHARGGYHGNCQSGHGSGTGDSQSGETSAVESSPGRVPWGWPQNEEYAKSIGFKGALVPGATTSAYMAEMLVNFFGESWLKSGQIDLKFIGGGVVDKEMVTGKGRIRKKVAEDPGVRLVLDVSMENEEGQQVIAGTASGLVT